MITSINARQVLASVVTDAASTGASATITTTYIPNGIVRLTNSSLMSVGGIPAAVGGQFLTIENQTGNTIFINNNDSGASAANRIFTGTGANVAMNANATFNFLYDAVVGMWMISGGTGSGSGGGGSKNYLTPYVASTSSGVANIGNGNFELGSVTGWSLFTTTLTGVIPTGTITAGASSITSFMTISGGTQLSGNYSLSTNVGASYTAGQGFVSNPFFIDASDQAKVLGFSFDYAVESGAGNLNFSGTDSNTFAVYIYDVTNGWIQPAGVYNLVQNNGTGNCNGTFQTSINSTQYQIAVLTINTSAGPANIYWDDFFVGPQIAVNAPAISDWTSYDLVISASTPPTPGTVSVNNAKWRRVGDSMEIQYDFSQTSGGSAGSGNYYFPIPSGFTIDLSKFVYSGANDVGNCFVQGGGANGTGSVLIQDSKGLLVTATASTAPDGGLQAVSDGYFQLSDPSVTYSFTARFPIVGWSSNSVASNDTDTRVCTFRNHATSLYTFTVNTPINFGPADWDTHGGFDPSTGAYTAPVSGFYDVDLSDLYMDSGPSVNFRVFINGTQDVGLCQTTAFGGDQNGVSGSVKIKCNSGDIITVQPDNSGTLLVGSSLVPSLSITRVTGPAVVQASEAIIATYYATTSFTSSSTQSANFDTKLIDTHDIVTASAPGTGSWVATINIAGPWEVTCSLVDTANITVDCGLMIYKNGSPYLPLDWSGTGTGVPTQGDMGALTGSIIIPLLAGDQIDVRSTNTDSYAGAALGGNARTSIITLKYSGN